MKSILNNINIRRVVSTMIEKRKKIFNIVSLILFVGLFVVELYIFMLMKFGLTNVFFEGDASVLTSFDAIDSTLDLLMGMVILNLVVFIIYTFVISLFNKKIYSKS